MTALQQWVSMPDDPPPLVPRHSTARDATRATRGAAVDAVMRALGWPALPWQSHVNHIGHEKDITEPTFYYQTVVVSVQRQAGKTTLDFGSQVHNCLLGPGRKAWYTAQTGQHASDKWRDTVDNIFLKSPLAVTAKPSYSNGAQGLMFYNSSTLRPHPPTPGSLHSKQSDRNTIDEAWHFDEVTGRLLMQAITPTTTTRRKLTGERPQLWIMSTEGTSESTWFNPIVDKYRAGNIPARSAFFDFGIPMDTPSPDMNRDDSIADFLETVWTWHPGAGHLFGREDLAGWLFDLGADEFMRAYGNRRTGSVSRVISDADVKAAETTEPIPDTTGLSFGAAVSVDGTEAAITVTAPADQTGEVLITEVLEVRAGTRWAITRIHELQSAHGGIVVIDRHGPSAELHDAAVEAGVDVVKPQLRDMTAATQRIHAGLTTRDDNGQKLPPTWLHRPHPDLNTAFDAVAKRSVGDGAYVWGRRASHTSIVALEAATCSTHGVRHIPEEEAPPVF